MAAAAAAKTAKSSDLCPETFGHGGRKEGRKEVPFPSSLFSLSLSLSLSLPLLREQIIRSKMCKYCSREAAGKEGRERREKRHRRTNQQRIFVRFRPSRFLP